VGRDRQVGNAGGLVEEEPVAAGQHRGGVFYQRADAHDSVLGGAGGGELAVGAEGGAIDLC